MSSSSTTVVYRIQGLSKVIGEDVLLHRINATFPEGAKVGIVGPKQASKSSLLRIIAGLDEDFEGSAGVVGDQLSVGYLGPAPILDDELSVLDCLQASVAHLRAIEVEYDEVCMDVEGKEDEFSALQDRMDHHRIWDLDARLKQVACALFLPAPESKVVALSPADRHSVALCMLLLEEPGLLLLDEPSRHLDRDTTEWLAGFLRDYRGSVFLVSKDRVLLDRVLSHVLEIRSGEGHPFDGNYPDFLARRLGETPHAGEK